MGSVTVAVSGELKKKMNQLDTVNWSAVARKAFESQVEKLELVESIVSKSRATQKDADEIADKIKRSIWQRHETKT